MCWANNTKPGQLRTSPLQPLDLLASAFCFVAIIFLNSEHALLYCIYIHKHQILLTTFFSFYLKETIICGQIFNFNSDRTWCFWAASTIIFLFFFSVLQVSQPLLQIGWTAWQITLVPNWSQFNMIFVTKKLWKYHHLEIYRSLCIGLLSKLSSINFSPLSILQPDMFPNKKSPRSLWTTIMPEAKQSISISY